MFWIVIWFLICIFYGNYDLPEKWEYITFLIVGCQSFPEVLKLNFILFISTKCNISFQLPSQATCHAEPWFSSCSGCMFSPCVLCEYFNQITCSMVSKAVKFHEIPFRNHLLWEVCFRICVTKASWYKQIGPNANLVSFLSVLFI